MLKVKYIFRRFFLLQITYTVLFRGKITVMPELFKPKSGLNLIFVLRWNHDPGIPGPYAIQLLNGNHTHTGWSIKLSHQIS